MLFLFQFSKSNTFVLFFKIFMSSNSNSHHHLHSKLTAAGLLITLGIIYGDIGTSPLYVMNSIIGKNIINENLILGGLS